MYSDPVPVYPSASSRHHPLTPVCYAAVGMVLMQSSIAAALLGTMTRFALLALGLGLIAFAAWRSCSLVPASIAAQSLLLVVLSAIAFEWLSWFNSHLVFEPKLIAFRGICYILIGCGVLIGLGHHSARQWQSSNFGSTILAVFLALSGFVAWSSLGSLVTGDGSRGSFDESSPVALGFSSGTLAVAALAVGLRSRRTDDCVLGCSPDLGARCSLLD